jgi:hypothetical protein
MPESSDDSPYLAAVAFIDYVLVDVAERIPDNVKTRWTAALAEKFAHFAGKD